MHEILQKKKTLQKLILFITYQKKKNVKTTTQKEEKREKKYTSKNTFTLNRRFQDAEAEAPWKLSQQKNAYHTNFYIYSS